tara:strand:- start:78 stop:605 length:528 start_codon:yes stop_codon:yes gene_type:complete
MSILRTNQIQDTGTNVAANISGGVITTTNNIVAPNLVTSPSMASYAWSATDQNNSNTTIAVSNTIVNIGNDLASTGVYTCPVNGIYRATIWGMTGGDGGNSNSGLFVTYLSIDDSFPSLAYLKKYVEPAGTYAHFSADIMIPLNANQTLSWGLQANYRTLHDKFGTASFKLEHQT